MATSVSGTSLPPISATLGSSTPSTAGASAALTPTTSSSSTILSEPKSAASAKPPAGLGNVASRPRVTTTLWEDEGTLCFQVEAKGVCVARREDNDMINGTKLLNVAGMTRGRRDGILKAERIRHVVKVGAMHLKGVWIPFDRALAFATKENIVDLLYPLFLVDIKSLLYHTPISQTRGAQMPQADAYGRGKDDYYHHQYEANGDAANSSNSNYSGHYYYEAYGQSGQQPAQAPQSQSHSYPHPYPPPPQSSPGSTTTASPSLYDYGSAGQRPVGQHPQQLYSYPAYTYQVSPQVYSHQQTQGSQYQSPNLIDSSSYSADYKQPLQYSQGPPQRQQQLGGYYGTSLQPAPSFRSGSQYSRTPSAGPGLPSGSVLPRPLNQPVSGE